MAGTTPVLMRGSPSGRSTAHAPPHPVILSTCVCCAPRSKEPAGVTPIPGDRPASFFTRLTSNLQLRTSHFPSCLRVFVSSCESFSRWRKSISPLRPTSHFQWTPACTRVTFRCTLGDPALLRAFASSREFPAQSRALSCASAFHTSHFALQTSPMDPGVRRGDGHCRR